MEESNPIVFWGAVSAGLTAIIVFIGVLWNRVLGPFVFRPGAKLVRHEVKEIVVEVVDGYMVPVKERLDSIEDELKVNGGDSVKDIAVQTRDAVEALRHDHDVTHDEMTDGMIRAGTIERRRLPRHRHADPDAGAALPSPPDSGDR